MKHLVSGVLIGAATLFIGCDSPTSSEQSNPVHFKNLFPLSTKGDCWFFSDSSSNTFSIEVSEAVTDNNERYHNVRFTESKMNSSQTHWLYSKNDTIYYAPKLQGSYAAFLPLKFNRMSSTFKSGSNKITYTRIKGYVVGKSTYAEAVSLKYETAILNGFTELVFVDGIGPIRCIDHRGRWPIIYNLDSAKISGIKVVQ